MVQRAAISRDVILAAAVTAYGLLVTFVRIGDGTIYHGPRLPNAIVSVLVTSTLAWRQTRPLLALTWIFAVYAATFAVVRHDLQFVAGFLVIIVLVASAAYHASRRDALACLAVGLAAIAVLTPLEPQLGGWFGAVFDAAFVALPWLAARALRSREERATALGTRLALAQARQREILLEERAQIARELHDIVAHSVSVILLQVGAARMRAHDQPGRRRAAARGRGERTPGPGRTAAPARGPEWLPRRRSWPRSRHGRAGTRCAAAVNRHARPAGHTVRAAGLDIDLAIGGEVRPLPPGLELSVYRIVQEALTNVLKHAQASTARVRVDYGPDAVTIDVVDDGTTRTVAAPRPAMAWSECASAPRSSAAPPPRAPRLAGAGMCMPSCRPNSHAAK